MLRYMILSRQQYRNLIIIIAITFTLVPTLVPNFGSYGWYGQLVVSILSGIVSDFTAWSMNAF